MCLSETTQRTINQTWVGFGYRLKQSRPNFFITPGTKILHNNIGYTYQFFDKVDISSLLQIQRNTSFTAIDTNKICTDISYKWRSNERVSSPYCGCSIFTTSAPKSASCIVPYGTDRTRPKSTTYSFQRQHPFPIQQTNVTL